MPNESTVTITKKFPYAHLQQSVNQSKKPLSERVQDVKNDMVVKLMKQELEKKYLENSDAPPPSNLNDNLQHGL